MEKNNREKINVYWKEDSFEKVTTEQFPEGCFGRRRLCSLLLNGTRMVKEE